MLLLASLNAIYRQPSVGYNLPPSRVSTYMQSITALLEKGLRIWPNPFEALHAGRKLDVLTSVSRCVAHVASQNEGMPHMIGATIPAYVVEDPCAFVERAITRASPSAFVLKRSMSDATSHVMHPDFHRNVDNEQKQRPNPRSAFLGQFLEGYSTSQLECRGLSPAYQPTWFCQPYRKEFSLHGELRLHFIGMTLVQQTLTSWAKNNPSVVGDMFGENIALITPLDRLRWVFQDLSIFLCH